MRSIGTKAIGCLGPNGSSTSAGQGLGFRASLILVSSLLHAPRRVHGNENTLNSVILIHPFFNLTDRMMR